jgi:CspA family cold shock protein
MTSTTVATSPLVTSSARILGRVKWFNNKAGYGFITANEGSKAGSDIFVHHSGIQVSSEQYRYLVQGEYVEFSITKTEGGAHEFQAGDVSGIHGGKLMCETRKDFRQTRSTQKSESGGEVDEASPKPVVNNTKKTYASVSVTSTEGEKPKSRGSGPRDGAEWTLVKNGKSAKKEEPSKSKRTYKPRSKAAPVEA